MQSIVSLQQSCSAQLGQQIEALSCKLQSALPSFQCVKASQVDEWYFDVEYGTQSMLYSPVAEIDADSAEPAPSTLFQEARAFFA